MDPLTRDHAYRSAAQRNQAQSSLLPKQKVILNYLIILLLDTPTANKHVTCGSICCFGRRHQIQYHCIGLIHKSYRDIMYGVVYKKIHCHDRCVLLVLRKCVHHLLKWRIQAQERANNHCSQKWRVLSSKYAIIQLK